jgi:hypothetical protein
MKIARVPTQIEYVKFGGGLDLVSPALSIPPGAALTAHNYEPGVNGGYTRIDGYERYSGQPAPSDAAYTLCEVSFVGAVAVNDTITGATSGATGVVVVVGAASLAITKVSGTFTSSENFTVLGVTKGAMTATPIANGCTTGLAHATALAAAADEYRADIAAPTGSGAIRGIVELSGTAYCFVDNAGATAGLIYKATTAGWAAVTLYKIISFTTGTSSTIADGATITQLVSLATATVKRQVIVSGTIAGGTAAGYLVIDVTGGTFDATNAIQVGGVTKCTASSLATQIAISPGGRYEFDVYNFTGSTATRRIYGCDGVNKGFEFDGAVYIPITTGMTTDTPLHVRCHKKMLHYSFRGSLQSSGIGNPFSWSAVTGASEIGMGETISVLLEQPGQALAIATRNSTSQLLGSSVSDFNLQQLAPDVGAIPYTGQNLGVGYWLDDRGVIQITRTQAFGNFDNATVSRKVQPAINAIRSVVTCSSVYRSRNQYRLYGSDGTGVAMTIVDGRYGPEFHFSTFEYPVYISCAWSGEDVNGKDIVLLGATNGMVYQADKGSSFDGTAIEAYLRLPFNHSKSPNTIKSYRRAQIEMTAVGYASIRFQPEFSYGDYETASHLTSTSAIQGSGSYWGVGSYEQIYYDATVVGSPEFSIAGDGKNMGLICYSSSTIDLGHTLQGLVQSYTPRRIQR